MSYSLKEIFFWASENLSENITKHLKSRGVDPEKTKVVLDTKNNLAVFLLYNLSGQLVGYQQYNPTAPKSGKGGIKRKDQKYFTYVAKRYKNLLGVWGLETVRDEPFLFVTEGIFDAVKLHNEGLPAVAVLGNNPKTLRPWLQILKATKKIIVVADNDKAGKKLGNMGDISINTPEPYKDLGEMPQEEVLSWLKEKLGMQGKNSKIFESNNKNDIGRLHFSKNKISKVKNTPKQAPGAKPIGFWYSVGRAWQDWAKNNFWELGDYIYRIDLDMSKILLISNLEEMTKFNDEFGIKDKGNTNGWNIGNNKIHWEEVAKQYSGIEINPFEGEGKYTFGWYGTWDIASGCIWDASAVKDLTRVTIEKNPKPQNKEIDEEYIGSKGGLSYFQMGRSLPDKLYNRTSNGKKSTRKPGVPGLKKENKKMKYSLRKIFLDEAARGPATLPEDVSVSIEPYMGNIVVKYTENSSGVEGYVEMKLAKKGTLGAYVIFQSEATKGYGPLLYDLAIEIAGNHGVTADRGSVSSDASNVWEYYYKNRNDITKKPLDDEDDPKTTPVEDDANFDASRAGGAISFMGGGTEVKRPWLNFVYYATSKNNFNTLKQMNKLNVDKELTSEGTVPQGSAKDRQLHGAPTYFNPTGRTLPKHLKDNGALKKSRKWNKDNNLIDVGKKVKDEKRKKRWYQKEKKVNENFNIHYEILRQNRNRHFEARKQTTAKRAKKRGRESLGRVRLTDIFYEGPIMGVTRSRKDYSQGVEVDLPAMNQPFYYATSDEYGSGDYIETPAGEQLIIALNSNAARSGTDIENARIYRVLPIGDIEWIEKNDNASLLTAPMLRVIDESEKI